MILSKSKKSYASFHIAKSGKLTTSSDIFFADLSFARTGTLSLFSTEQLRNDFHEPQRLHARKAFYDYVLIRKVLFTCFAEGVLFLMPSRDRTFRGIAAGTQTGRM